MREMAGLVDSTTGLSFGSGLQWQDPLGDAGLTIMVGAVPANAYVTEDGLKNYVTEDGLKAYVSES